MRDMDVWISDVKVDEDSSVQQEVWGSPVRRKRSGKRSRHQNAEAETEVKPAPDNKLVKVNEFGGHGGSVLDVAYRVEARRPVSPDTYALEMKRQAEELATELARPCEKKHSPFIYRIMESC